MEDDGDGLKYIILHSLRVSDGLLQLGIHHASLLGTSLELFLKLFKHSSLMLFNDLIELSIVVLYFSLLFLVCAGGLLSGLAGLCLLFREIRHNCV